ncbi:MAG: hypothetical protein LBL94_06395 [Prevotellaceae bacterium]|jgi:hypothetical protein|nr:hypothetical protein [Prevotellaceae bacterium]
MAIKVKINIDWEKVKEETIREIDERVAIAFERASEKAVTWAKENKGYSTQSGALSSSTGYQLYKDGSLLRERFEKSESGTDENGAKAKGIAAGKVAAEQRASELGAHICTVIVAGMPYAAHVENTGHDVLAGAENQFMAILEEEMQKAFAESDVPYSIITD